MGATRLTEIWCRQVKQTEEQKDYYDSWEPIPGKSGRLVMRVGKTGTKTWMLIYSLNGKKSRFKLGNYPSVSLADARQLASKELTAILDGNDPADQRRKEKEAATFKELAQIYLERYAVKKKKPRSIEEDIRILERELYPPFGEMKAGDVTRKDVIALLDTIADRAPIMANRTLALIRKIYNFGIERDLVKSTPCLMVKAPGKEHQRQRVLSDSELKLIWIAMDSLTPLMQAMLKLRLLTAQRGNEVASMRWQDIDLESGWWTIPQERAKNGMAHRVPLTSQAVDLIRSINSPSEWLFPSGKNGVFFISNTNKALIKLRSVTGIPDFTLHDMRRTAASCMTSIGVSRLVVSKILNHVEQGVTAVYDRHSYDSEKRLALEKWSKHLQRITSQKENISKVVNLR